jgi:hypothetical protein
MSINIILNILFAIVLSGCAIKDVVYHLNNDRLHDPLTHLLNRRGFLKKLHPCHLPHNHIFS